MTLGSTVGLGREPPTFVVTHEIFDITAPGLINCLSSQAGLRIVQAGSAVDLGCERMGGEH